LSANAAAAPSMTAPFAKAVSTVAVILTIVAPPAASSGQVTTIKDAPESVSSAATSPPSSADAPTKLSPTGISNESSASTAAASPVLVKVKANTTCSPCTGKVGCSAAASVNTVGDMASDAATGVAAGAGVAAAGVSRPVVTGSAASTASAASVAINCAATQPFPAPPGAQQISHQSPASLRPNSVTAVPLPSLPKSAALVEAASRTLSETAATVPARRVSR
jgi:hypothetical protein